MLQDARPVTFVATADPARALHFYRDVLGLPLSDDGPHALVFDNRGVPLRVQKAATITPAPYTVLGWDVLDIAAEVATLVERGVVLERYPWLEQDSAGVWTTPGGARVAWFTDPDGNVLSLCQLP